MNPAQPKPPPSCAESPSGENMLHKNQKGSYLLDLGKGLSWCLSGSEKAQPHVEKIARVLGSQSGSHDAWPLLVLGSNPTSFKVRRLAERIPTQGWTIEEFPDARIWSHSAVQDIFCEGRWDGNPNGFFRMWTVLIHTIYRRAIECGGLPIHAALIAREGVGIALVGASGRGKTTCCRRIPAPWQALADDHTLVLANECERFDALPFPTWGDVLPKDGIPFPRTQVRVPLSALFFLEQTEADEVTPMGPGEAAVRINQAAYEIFRPNLEILENARPGTARARVFENACAISKKVKTYRLGVSLNGQFWDSIAEVIYLTSLTNHQSTYHPAQATFRSER
jgi:SynChlorMet cassette protein ScmC